MADPYNPLDKQNLGRSVADALLESKCLPLSEAVHLKGAGIYALYYTGQFSAYTPIMMANLADRFLQPIYVGKAIPKGGRKGGLGTDAALGYALRDRLRQHEMTIKEAENLDIGDFYFRSLVVDEIWIPLGENMMIEMFRPVWNVIIDGFGNKTPGSGRSGQQRSNWDVLHPGRKFVSKLGLKAGTLETIHITDRLREFYAGRTKGISDQPGDLNVQADASPEET